MSPLYVTHNGSFDICNCLIDREYTRRYILYGLVSAYGMCLQHERDISGGRCLSRNMVSSDCKGMSTLLILCKPVWGMICSAAQHPFLMENSPASRSIMRLEKGMKSDTIQRCVQSARLKLCRDRKWCLVQLRSQNPSYFVVGCNIDCLGWPFYSHCCNRKLSHSAVDYTGQVTICLLSRAFHATHQSFHLAKQISG